MRVWLAIAQASSTVADASAEYLRAGLLGATCVILAVVVVYLWRDNKAIQKAHIDTVAQLQQARVSDAQDVTAKLLQVNQSCVSTMAKLDASLEAQRESTAELRSALRDLALEIREGRSSSRRER